MPRYLFLVSFCFSLSALGFDHTPGNSPGSGRPVAEPSTVQVPTITPEQIAQLEYLISQLNTEFTGLSF